MASDPDTAPTLSEPDVNAAWTHELLGTTLAGRYRIDEVIGIGAMGAVFRAHQLGLKRDVAVKLLDPRLTGNQEMRARFEREAAAASKLDHRNCVRVHDYGITEDGHHYLVMEHLVGEELADRIGQPMPPDRALVVVDQVLAGLEHAHGHGLVHRDVKPENVFMTRDAQGNEVAKLVDFGIVKLRESMGGQQLTQYGMVFGTAYYMSPEQAAAGKVDARADLYSVGVILYTLLSGRLPFEGDDAVAVLKMQIREQPPPLPESVDPELRALVGKLMEKQREDRYADATETRRALQRILRRLTEGTKVQAPASRTRQLLVKAAAQPRRNLILGAARVLVLVGGVAAVVTATGGDPANVAAKKGNAKADVSDSIRGEAVTKEGDPIEIVGDDEPSADGGNTDRALQANLASIDALMDAGKHDAALIALEPLVENYSDSAALQWRMGKVLMRLGGTENRARSLKAYHAAVAAQPSLLDDDEFGAELGSLLEDPKLRVPAVELSVELLGERAHDQLLTWLNTQVVPLPYDMRHRIITHLEAGGRGDDINRPLQNALDLWQAKRAESPCKAFYAALTAAEANPDSYLVGTLSAVSVPPKAPPAEGQDPVPCPGAAKKLAEVRASYEQRYPGIDRTIPKAYRPRPRPQRRRRRR